MRTFLVASIGALGLLFAATALTPASADGPTNVHPVVHDSGDTLDVDIVAEGVKDLGGYQFVLSWDSGLVKFDTISNAGFLGNSGRKPYCPNPVIESGAARIACVTLDPQTQAQVNSGATPIPGSNGTGVLATAHFHIVKSGRLQLHLSRVQLVDPLGKELPSQSTDASYSTSGSASRRWWLIGGAIGGGAVLVILAVAAVLVLRARRHRSGGSLDEQDMAHVADRWDS